MTAGTRRIPNGIRILRGGIASKFGATDSESLRGVTRTSERGVAVEMVGASHLEAPGVQSPGGGPETHPAPRSDSDPDVSGASPAGNDGAWGAGS